MKEENIRVIPERYIKNGTSTRTIYDFSENSNENLAVKKKVSIQHWYNPITKETFRSYPPGIDFHFSMSHRLVEYLHSNLHQTSTHLSNQTGIPQKTIFNVMEVMFEDIRDSMISPTICIYQAPEVRIQRKSPLLLFVLVEDTWKLYDYGFIFEEIVEKIDELWSHPRCTPAKKTLYLSDDLACLWADCSLSQCSYWRDKATFVPYCSPWSWEPILHQVQDYFGSYVDEQDVQDILTSISSQISLIRDACNRHSSRIQQMNSNSNFSYFLSNIKLLRLFQCENSSSHLQNM